MPAAVRPLQAPYWLKYAPSTRLPLSHLHTIQYYRGPPVAVRTPVSPQPAAGAPPRPASFGFGHPIGETRPHFGVTLARSASGCLEPLETEH